MSASREKRKRQELNTSGVSKQQTEPAEKKTPGWKIAVGWLIGIAFVICFAVVMLLNSSFLAKHTTAMTVGEHKLSPAMVNVYYNSSFNNFYSSYGDYISLFFDPSQPLDDQIYDEVTGQSWSDYFMSTAKDSMVWAYTLYDQASKEGLTLTDEEKSTIDASINSFKEAATTNGFSSSNGYLAAAFGKGVDTKLYREFMEVQYLAASYYNNMLDGFSFTDEEKFAYYADHLDRYDTVYADYTVLSGTAPAKISTDADGNETTVEPTEEENAAALEAAREQAQQILSGGAAALEEVEDLRNISDYQKDSITNVLPAEAADWLFDAARVEGDMEIFEAESTVYVVRFAERDNHDYITRNIRLIQIAPEVAKDVLNAAGEKDDAATEEAQQAFNDEAKQEAKKIFETWQDGEATEESFIELVKQHSDDALSKENDGLVENVSKIDFTKAVSEWLYSDLRQAGDVKLFTEEDVCFVIYYLGEGQNYQLFMVQNDMLSDAYNEWYVDASASYAVKEQAFGMRFVSVR